MRSGGTALAFVSLLGSLCTSDQVSHLVGFEAENACGGLDRPAARRKTGGFSGSGLGRDGDPSIGPLDVDHSCSAGLVDCGVSLNSTRDPA